MSDLHWPHNKPWTQAETCIRTSCFICLRFFGLLIYVLGGGWWNCPPSRNFMSSLFQFFWNLLVLVPVNLEPFLGEKMLRLGPSFWDLQRSVTTPKVILPSGADLQHQRREKRSFWGFQQDSVCEPLELNSSVFVREARLFTSGKLLISVFFSPPQVNELSNVPVPVMLMPDDFKAYSKIKVDNHLFNKYVPPVAALQSMWWL